MSAEKLYLRIVQVKYKSMCGFILWSNNPSDEIGSYIKIRMNYTAYGPYKDDEMYVRKMVLNEMNIRSSDYYALHTKMTPEDLDECDHLCKDNETRYSFMLPCDHYVNGEDSGYIVAIEHPEDVSSDFINNNILSSLDDAVTTTLEWPKDEYILEPHPTRFFYHIKKISKPMLTSSIRTDIWEFDKEVMADEASIRLKDYYKGDMIISVSHPNILCNDPSKTWNVTSILNPEKGSQR